jgi:uncharacterized protein (DUF1015 family)
MADVQPFRAIRYAHPTPSVTAPPYDVIDDETRERLLALDPHNVVHLTLNPSEDEAGRLFRAWLAEGILVEEARPAFWTVAQDYVGPDGVARRREGIVGSLRVEPYETRVVLPHERTHAGPKRGRLRLLRAVEAQLEPIFLLYDGTPPVVPPEREPDLQAGDTRLWRTEEDGVTEFFSELQLLIADGHHRYETAVEYARETGANRMMGVLVSTADDGLEVFPTHRVFARPRDFDLAGEAVPSVPRALERLAAEPYERSVAVYYDGGEPLLIRGAPGELDVELVDRFGHEGISYTPDASAAARRVEGGDAEFAFLLRPTRIEDVFRRAREGRLMPQKTTYFFPKLLSGLLFHRTEHA